MHFSDDDNGDDNDDDNDDVRLMKMMIIMKTPLPPLKIGQFCLNAPEYDMMVRSMIKCRWNTKSVGKKCKLIFQVPYCLCY